MTPIDPAGTWLGLAAALALFLSPDGADAAGPQVFRLEPRPGETRTTACDCFLLTRGPFVPRGPLKPDEAFAIEEPGWFAFQPAPEPAVSLRRLNGRAAGEHGLPRLRGRAASLRAALLQPGV